MKKNIMNYDCVLQGILRHSAPKKYPKDRCIFFYSC